MLRWAEAGLGAWRRWSEQDTPSDHHLLVVDSSESLANELRALAPGLRISRVDVVTSRSSTLEALATQLPTAVVFDLDLRELAPSVEMLEWLATEFPQIRRIGCSRATGSFLVLRERGLYHAILSKPPTTAELTTALPSMSDPTPPRA